MYSINVKTWSTSLALPIFEAFTPTQTERSTNTQWKSVFTEVLLYLDMIIFFLNAPLHPSPYYRALQTAHTLSLSAFSLSFPFSVSHPLTPLVLSSPHHSHSLKCLSVKTLLCSATGPANTIGQRATVQARASTVPELCFCVSVDSAAYTSVCVCADTCMYTISSEWIMKGLHPSNSAQVVRFSPFKALGDCGSSAIWPSWWLEACGQAHISQGFNWHIIQLCCWPRANTLTWLLFNKKHSLALCPHWIKKGKDTHPIGH